MHSSQSSVQFQVAQLCPLLQPHGLQHVVGFLSITNSGACSDSYPPVGDAIKCLQLLSLLLPSQSSQHQVFQGVRFFRLGTKYWSLELHQSFHEDSGLISCGIINVNIIINILYSREDTIIKVGV